METKRPPGRPPEWQDCVEPAWFYVNGGYETVNDPIPSIAGLAVYLNKSRETIHTWAKTHKQFSDIVEKLLAIQEGRLVAGGLTGGYNASITKLLLTKHGYSDKQETAVSGVDGGPIEIVERVIIDPTAN